MKKKTAEILSNIQRPVLTDLSPPEAQKAPYSEVGEMDNWIIFNGKVYTDDRTDLPDDTIFWLQMYASAGQWNEELYKHLRFIRNKGTQIVKGKNGYIIRPIIGAGGWSSQREYERYRDKFLNPHRNMIADMLKKLFSWDDCS